MREVSAFDGTRPADQQPAARIGALVRANRTEPVVVVSGQHPDMIAHLNAEYPIEARQ